jgi:hypothetical protein
MNPDVLKMLGIKQPKACPEIRDAVHVACIVLDVVCQVYPGQHAGVTNNCIDPLVSKKIGIVDPFLKEIVYPGEKCFLFLYPGTVTSLVHHWGHPDFKSETPSQALIDSMRIEIDKLKNELVKAKERSLLTKEEAEKFLREVAAEGYVVDYDKMLKDLEQYGSYTEEGGANLQDRYNYNDRTDKIWDAVFVLTGVRHTGAPFSCSC